MTSTEHAIAFQVNGETLYGIVHAPQKASTTKGILIVVGGPQTRVGSHRQFVLLARFLADEGIPAMRFDYRGMGDSQGDARNFEAIGPDIRAALDAFQNDLDDLKEITLWGLCDAASAAAFYGPTDPRVVSLILLNPWVRSEDGLAKAYLKHYYVSRLLNPGLWRKIFKGKFNLVESLRSLFQNLITALGLAKPSPPLEQSPETTAPLADRMFEKLKLFNGKILLILSGNDLTAAEFKDLEKHSRQWHALLKQRRITQYELPFATHTFSRREWRDQVAIWTRDWLKS